ncbi:hypothetical protein FXO38_27321 [Capsicum annuum]|nr:hypothetical protein FXO38_27321 [Capsicum annuum]
MKYLRGTVNYGISYSGFTSTLEGYCDANWISNSNETKSTSGYVFTLGGDAVSSRSAKQTIIARSTMKSEFVTLELAGLPILTQTLQLKLKASEESVIRIRNQYLALHAKLKEKDETNERSRGSFGARDKGLNPRLALGWAHPMFGWIKCMDNLSLGIVVYVVDDSVKFKEAVKHGNLIPRYSVIEAQPIMEIVAKENMVTIVDHFEGSRTEEFLEDPMINPHKIMEKWKPQCIDELPEAFCGQLNENSDEFRCLSMYSSTRLEQKHFATSGVDFLHRVRRTARAGQPGLVTSLYKESNHNLVAAIMDETGISCIDERRAHLMLDPSYEPFRKHGSDLI